MRQREGIIQTNVKRPISFNLCQEMHKKDGTLSSDSTAKDFISIFLTIKLVLFHIWPEVLTRITDRGITLSLQVLITLLGCPHR